MNATPLFRFDVQEHRVLDGKAWRQNARDIESMGYSALYLPDHLDDQLGPIAALMSAADATTTLRVGSLVFDNDYRHPVVLAKEVGTLDLLSGGRFDLGLGAGWLRSDYDQSGIPYDPPATRIDRMEEGLKVIKGLLAGGKFSFSGKYYSINGAEGDPPSVQKPHPPIIMGGGGRRMLGLAAREADIVHVNYNLREGRINPTLVQTGFAQAIDEKIGWIKQAAGDRLHDIALGLTVFFATVTPDRESVATVVASGIQAEVSDVLEMPFFLIGTIDQIVEQLLARRERYGVSQVIVPGEAAESLQPVVERLSGR